MEKQITILVVDDDKTNLEIISEYLIDEDYQVLTAIDGKEALALLESKQEEINTILLDWMMPEMDGLELLRIIKERQEFQNIPVIMQTAKARSEDIVKGINAGAYYYLTKPFEENVLLSIVKAAITDFNLSRSLRERIRKEESISGLMDRGYFRFKTIREAENLAYWIANASPAPKATIVGLFELFINAIEHGNLGIGYAEKSLLMENGTWWNEIHQRLELPEHSGKYVEVTFEKKGEQIKIRIKDQGRGFDFKKYLEMDENRVFDNHGRGIIMAKMMSFDELHYLGCGNEVKASVMSQK